MVGGSIYINLFESKFIEIIPFWFLIWNEVDFQTTATQNFAEYHDNIEVETMNSSRHKILKQLLLKETWCTLNFKWQVCVLSLFITQR